MEPRTCGNGQCRAAAAPATAGTNQIKTYQDYRVVACRWFGVDLRTCGNGNAALLERVRRWREPERRPPPDEGAPGVDGGVEIGASCLQSDVRVGALHSIRKVNYVAEIGERTPGAPKTSAVGGCHLWRDVRVSVLHAMSSRFDVVSRSLKTQSPDL